MVPILDGDREHSVSATIATLVGYVKKIAVAAVLAAATVSSTSIALATAAG